MPPWLQIHGIANEDVERISELARLTLPQALHSSEQPRAVLTTQVLLVPGKVRVTHADGSSESLLTGEYLERRHAAAAAGAAAPRELSALTRATADVDGWLLVQASELGDGAQPLLQHLHVQLNPSLRGLVLLFVVCSVRFCSLGGNGVSALVVHLLGTVTEKLHRWQACSRCIAM